MSEVRAGSSEVRATATDELRRLLDERGVEWSNGHGDCDDHAGTLWDGIGGRWYAGGMTGVCGNRLYLETPADRTPEQAVAATLGPGTCHPIVSDNLNESEGTGDAWADCSECGHLLFVLTEPNSQPPNYCPGCGRRVVE